MLEQFYRINQAAGINVHIRQDGSILINSCSVIAKGNRLDIDKKVLDIYSIEELKKHFPAKTVVALNLSGKGILYKQIEKIEAIEQGNFNKILPNANVDDFYIQNFISGEYSFVSVIRKTDGDKWIEGLKLQGFVPLALSLCVFPAEHIITQLNLYESGLQFGGNIIQRDEQSHWLSYRYDETALSPFTLKVASEVISEKLVVPYAAAFQLVLSEKLSVTVANVSTLETEVRGVLSNNKLRVNGAILLLTFFVLLLINFVAFSWLETSNSHLKSQVSRFTLSATTIQDIEQQVKKKELLLRRLGWDGNINKGALIDQLSSLMPEEISLKEVAINPIDLNSSRAQKTLIFFDRHISITGTSDKIIPVNEWMARIKTKPWIKNVQMESYTYNNELSTGQFNITLKY